MFDKKRCFRKFCKIGRESPVMESLFNNVFNFFFNNFFVKNSDPGFFLWVLRNFWEHFFYRILPGDCFWIGLIVKIFNYMSLIFFNLKLNHAPPEWPVLFWCNEEHLLMKKMSAFNSGTAIICEWNQREHVLTFFRIWVALGLVLQGSSDTFFGTFRCILGQPMI